MPQQSIKGKVYKVGLDKPDILRLGAFGAIVPEAVKQKALKGKDALLTKKITFEDCKIGGKDSWCVKETKSA